MFLYCCCSATVGPTVQAKKQKSYSIAGTKYPAGAKEYFARSAVLDVSVDVEPGKLYQLRCENLGAFVVEPDGSRRPVEKKDFKSKWWSTVSEVEDPFEIHVVCFVFEQEPTSTKFSTKVDKTAAAIGVNFDMSPAFFRFAPAKDDRRSISLSDLEWADDQHCSVRGQLVNSGTQAVNDVQLRVDYWSGSGLPARESVFRELKLSLASKPSQELSMPLQPCAADARLVSIAVESLSQVAPE